MGRPSKHSPEVRERAVRMVFDHAAEHPSQWAAIRSVGEKLGVRKHLELMSARIRRQTRHNDREARPLFERRLARAFASSQAPRSGRWAACRARATLEIAGRGRASRAMPRQN